MRQGKMYRIKGLAKNRINKCMKVQLPYSSDDIALLETENPNYTSRTAKLYRDGDIVVCLGKKMRETHHYQRQPFYKVLTLTGEIAYVSKGSRNKYFELVRREE